MFNPTSEWYWKRYWTSKRKTNNTLTYLARDGIEVNPRIFFMNHDRVMDLRNYGYKSWDKIANDCLVFARERITYKSDEGEKWQFPFETLHRQEGDCEDFSILVANMMIASGIPIWRVRVCAGNVRDPTNYNLKVGHAYVTYCRQSDNQWYILDATYWFEKTKDFKLKWKTAEDYFDIWFSFDKSNIYKDKV